MSVHTSPMADISDCGSLLLEAGFHMPTVDQDTLKVAGNDDISILGEFSSAVLLYFIIFPSFFLGFLSECPCTHGASAEDGRGKQFN